MIAAAMERIADTGFSVDSSLQQGACKNLHADTEGLKRLTLDLETLFPGLRPIAPGSSFSISYPSSQDLPPKPRRGPSKAKRRGWQHKAKHQRRRCPDRLRAWQVESLFAADRFARAIGTPLNAFFTVAWLNTGEGDEGIQRRFQAACKAMGEWLRRRGVPRAWVYCHENPNGTRPNLHMLIHLPHNLFPDFRKAAAGWFDAVDGGIHLRPRNGPADRCLPYLVKGTDLVTARRHGATARRQGPIHFKRAGWSESLGKTAMERFNAASRAL